MKFPVNFPVSGKWECRRVDVTVSATTQGELRRCAKGNSLRCRGFELDLKAGLEKGLVEI